MEMDLKEKTSGGVYGAALLYAAIIGFSFLFTKLALSAASPLDILAHRFTFAFGGMVLLSVLGLVRVHYSVRRLLRILPLALFYPLLFFSFQTFGLRYASSSEGAILSASAPIFILILARLVLKEGTNTLQKLSVLLSVSGVIYITLMKGAAIEGGNARGIGLLLLSNLALAGYTVLARILTREFSNMELTVAMVTISFVAFNGLAISSHLQAGTLATFFAPLRKGSYLVAVTYLGILSSLLSSLLTNFVLSRMQASRMSVFSNLATVISIAAGVFFLKEEIHYYHIVGSIFIVGGVIGTNFLGHKKRAEDKPSA